jgi:hypothetical protein
VGDRAISRNNWSGDVHTRDLAHATQRSSSRSRRRPCHENHKPPVHNRDARTQTVKKHSSVRGWHLAVIVISNPAAEAEQRRARYCFLSDRAPSPRPRIGRDVRGILVQMGVPGGVPGQPGTDTTGPGTTLACSGTARQCHGPGWHVGPNLCPGTARQLLIGPGRGHGSPLVLCRARAQLHNPHDKIQS